MILLAVACGGALGALLRFGVGRLVGALTQTMSGGVWASLSSTLTVNLIGSLTAGVLFAWTLQRASEPQPWLMAFFATGVLGGFTTFSAFSREVLELAQSGQLTWAASYALLGWCLPLLGVFVGFWLVR